MRLLCYVTVSKFCHTANLNGSIFLRPLFYKTIQFCVKIFKNIDVKICFPVWTLYNVFCWWIQKNRGFVWTQNTWGRFLNFFFLDFFSWALDTVGPVPVILLVPVSWYFQLTTIWNILFRRSIWLAFSK